MAFTDKDFLELSNKLTELVVHYDTCKNDIFKLEKKIEKFEEELDLNKDDLKEVVIQFKGIVSQSSSSAVKLKEIVEEIELCKKEREDRNVLSFIKNKPLKAAQIFIVVAIFLAIFLSKIPDAFWTWVKSFF